MHRLLTFLLLFSCLNPVGFAGDDPQPPKNGRPQIGNDGLMIESYEQRLNRYSQIQRALNERFLRRQARKNGTDAQCPSDIKKLSDE